MTALAKVWVIRAKHMHKDAERARAHADSIRHHLEKAQQVAKEAVASLKRAQLRLTVTIAKR